MLGGALGSAARLLVGRAMTTLLGAGFPWGTLTVNLAGGLAMGLLAGGLARLTVPGEPWRLLLGVGVLGGFTTFSAFALDAVTIIERGDWGAALGYALVSVVGSVLAVFAGLGIMRAFA
jgi:CrcB protein